MGSLACSIIIPSVLPQPAQAQAIRVNPSLSYCTKPSSSHKISFGDHNITTNFHQTLRRHQLIRCWPTQHQISMVHWLYSNLWWVWWVWWGGLRLCTSVTEVAIHLMLKCLQNWEPDICWWLWGLEHFHKMSISGPDCLCHVRPSPELITCPKQQIKLIM